MNFQRWLVIFLIPLEVQRHTVPHFKALSHGKDGSRGLSNSYTCLGVLKMAIYYINGALSRLNCYARTVNTHTYLIFSHFNDCKRLQSYYNLPTPSLHSFTYILLTTHLSQFVNVNCECPQGNIQFLKTYLKVGYSLWVTPRLNDTFY